MITSHPMNSERNLISWCFAEISTDSSCPFLFYFHYVFVVVQMLFPQDSRYICVETHLVASSVLLCCEEIVLYPLPYKVVSTMVCLAFGDISGYSNATSDFIAKISIV